MKTIKKKLALIASTIIPAAAIAHPGHGHENPLSPGHYIANPQHYIPLVLTIVVAMIFIGAKYYFSRSKEKKSS